MSNKAKETSDTHVEAGYSPSGLGQWTRQAGSGGHAVETKAVRSSTMPVAERVARHQGRIDRLMAELKVAATASSRAQIRRDIKLQTEILAAMGVSANE